MRYYIYVNPEYTAVALHDGELEQLYIEGYTRIEQYGRHSDDVGEDDVEITKSEYDWIKANFEWFAPYLTRGMHE